jgi:hypothetical protein
MSLYEKALQRPIWVQRFASLNAELALVVRSHRVVDALFAFGLVVLPMIAMIALLFLLGSAEPSASIPDAMDGTGMLILPP